MKDIPFDPVEGKCSTKKTLEKEFNEIQANLYIKIETTSSPAASANDFINKNLKTGARPCCWTPPCKKVFGRKLMKQILQYLRRGGRRTERKR